MASIEIHRKHSKTVAEAKKSVERVAKHIAKKFDVEYGWDGNTLEFSRLGVDGHIAVAAKEISVIVELNFLLGGIRGAVEREIHKYLDQEFA
jgi:putative polyhydroxyalkanoate system protein